MSDNLDLSKLNIQPDTRTAAQKEEDAIQSSRDLIDGGCATDSAHTARFLSAVKGLATTPKSEFDAATKSRKSTHKNG